MPNLAVGIYLGNTKSCVAVCKNDQVKIMTNEYGSRFTPSMITFTKDYSLIGKESKHKWFRYPRSTCTMYEIEQLLERSFDDVQVQDVIKNVPYTIFKYRDQPKIKLDIFAGRTKEFQPKEISALILKKIKSIAEVAQENIAEVIVTVPLHFNTAQKQATRKAALMAGFKSAEVIEEPIAAVLATNHKTGKLHDRNVMVFNFDRYKCEITIIAIKANTFKIMSTKSDYHLGGSDVDINVGNFVKQHFEKKYGRQISDGSMEDKRIKSICKFAKKTLSEMFETKISLAYSAGEDFDLTISRTQFEQINTELFLKAFRMVQDCLVDSKVQREDIEEIVFLGGSSKIPKIEKMFNGFFGENKINKPVDQLEAIAYGAALCASKLRDGKIKTLQEISCYHTSNMVEPIQEETSHHSKPKCVNTEASFSFKPSNSKQTGLHSKSKGDKTEVLDFTSLPLETNFQDFLTISVPQGKPITIKYQKDHKISSLTEFSVYQDNKKIATKVLNLSAQGGRSSATTMTVEVGCVIDSNGLPDVSNVKINRRVEDHLEIDLKKSAFNTK